MSKINGSEIKNTLYCSFCGKSQHEVRKLIAGPTRDRPRQYTDLIHVDIAEIERDLLQTGNLETLPLLDDLNVVGGAQQGIGTAGIEPSDSAPHMLDRELTAFEINAVEVGDLQFSSRRWPQARCNLERIAIVEIEARQRIVGLRNRRLLLEARCTSGGVEVDHAIALWVADPISEHRSSAGARGRAIEQRGEPSAVEKIVTQNQGRRVAAEKVASDRDRPGDAVRARLLRIAEPDSPLAAVPQQPLKLRQISRRRDDENISDSGEHEHRQGIIDHRFVVDREELFRDCFGYGMEATRPSACEKNSTHLCLFELTSPGWDASPELAEIAKPIHRAAIAYSYRTRLELESDVSNVGQPVQAAALKQPRDRFRITALRLCSAPPWLRHRA
jgi:ClpX C4-type zinc finger